VIVIAAAVVHPQLALNCRKLAHPTHCRCCPAGFGAAAFMAPLLQNLCLSKGDNEEACYCLKVGSLQHTRMQQSDLQPV
jgi:hypothetical protein